MQGQIIRNKELTYEELQQLRRTPCYLSISSTEFILYNLVNKESNSGLFKNERLLILDTKNQTLSYLSKIPQGLIPFQNEAEVISQHPKERVSRSQIYENGVNQFSCREIPEKSGIQIKMSKSSKKIDWIVYFSHNEMMNEWFRHINFLFYSSRQQIDAFYHQKKPQIIPEDIKNEKEIISQHENKNSEQKQKKKQIDPFDDQYRKQDKDILYEPKGVDQGLTPNPDGPSMPKSDLNQLNSKVSDFGMNKEHDSQFIEFDQNTPLGTFLRSKAGSPEKNVSSESRGQELQSPNKYFREDNFNFNYIKGTYLKNDKESIGGNSRIRDESLKNSKDIANQDSPERQMYESIEKVNKESRGNEIKAKEDDEVHRSGIIIKNIPIPKIKNTEKQTQLQLAQTEWNQLYYQDRQIPQSTVYFDFVNQCLKYVVSLIDELPLEGNSCLKEDSDGYAYQIHNGVEYKLGIKLAEQESLIYELCANQPLVSDLYAYIDRLKVEFGARKQHFHNFPQQQHPLVLLIEYKQILVLCRATSQNKSSKVPTMSYSTKPEDSIIERMLSTELHITSSADFKKEMRKSNVALLDWGYLFKKCENSNFKRIFLSQIFCKIFLNILKSELFQMYLNFPLQKFTNPDIMIVQEVVADSSLHLIKRLFSEGSQADALWTLVTKETKRLYDIEGSRSSINENYLLYAILFNFGMETNQTVKINNILESLPQSLLKGTKPIIRFRPLVSCLNYEEMSSPLKVLSSILDCQGKIETEGLLKLRGEIAKEVPKSINYLQKEINLKLTAQIPYNVKGFSVGIYDILTKNEPSNYRYQTALSAVRWIFRESPFQAGDFSLRQIQDIIYYVGKIPLIACFYEVIASEQFLTGQYEKGILNYKRAIDELSEIFEQSSKALFQKKNDLSNIYLQLNRKEECLKQLLECKKIYEKTKMTQRSEYIKVLLKLSKVNLSVSKFNQSINYCLECLKNLQNQGPYRSGGKQNQTQFLQISEILLRAYELSRRTEESFGVANLCLEKCKSINDFKAYSKIIKIVLLPYLKLCDIGASHYFLSIIEELSSIYIESKLTKANLHQWARSISLLEHLDMKIPHYFKHIKAIYQKIQKQFLMEHFKTHLHRVFEENNEKNESLIFLMDFFLMTNFVGVSFFQGFLKENYY